MEPKGEGLEHDSNSIFQIWTQSADHTPKSPALDLFKLKKVTSWDENHH